MNSQILAMGGGGFSMEPENLKLDRYLLSLSATKNPKVCFIGTASGDAKGYIDNFYKSFSNFECETNHLSLFKPPEGHLRDLVLKQDILYIGGGNTRNLLVLWKEWGLHKILKEAWQKGIILSGISAGAICWFEQGLTDSVTGKLLPLEGLGFLQGSYCPHYDGEPERRPIYQKTIFNESMKPGIACDDGAAALFTNGKLEKFVSSQPNANAYKVELKKKILTEEKITPEFLKNF